jgi:hypothetical protein
MCKGIIIRSEGELGIVYSEKSGQLSLLFGFLALLSLTTLALSISTLVILHILVVDIESLVNLSAESRLILNTSNC